MSEDRRKLNKHCTGTVPKVKYSVKYRNNTGQQNPYDSENFRDLPNNLSLGWPSRRSESNFQRNSQHTNFETMDSSLEETQQNGIYGNGTATSSQTSSSNSRRNSYSTVPKCDNVTKYPNKKQIEDKLEQIKEYLHITSSLMSSMKNGDEQNSECGISNSTDGKNDFDVQTNREVLRAAQSVSFQHLKQRGDSRLRDARQLQERLAQGHSSSNSNRTENNLQEYDLAIAELVESTKRLNDDAKADVNNFQQQEASFINAEIEELQNQIQVMHSANEDRNKLIDLLDKRDAELRCQHLELQNKLIELQSKKSQVDHLVAALQTEPRQDDDVSGNFQGAHVQRIVLMKDQLAKLKDMLELVENTEEVMQNGTQEEQAIACEIYNKAENFLNKDIEKGNSSNQSHCDNQLQYENRASSSSINLDKHMNKNSRETRSQCNESKFSEKLALQAELKAKKRELEEIMGKHKASSSNLNHDVGTTDNKSDFSCSNSIFDNVSGVWAPLLPSQHNHNSSERYSSDEGTEDANEYTEIPSNQRNRGILMAGNGKYTSERNNSSDFLHAQVYERACPPFLRSPESNTRDGNPGFSRGSSVSNHGPIGKQNVQKQLELIRSVCDSMLPQQQQSGNNQQQQNVQHLRNNLTPSPVYSELRPFASPNAHPMNALNVVNPPLDNSWFSNPTNLPPPLTTDVNNYQNWLTTNTLQTQAFMLNSLNQCCQMLWLQQRELASLRGTVAALQQERLPSPHYNTEDQLTNQGLNCNQVEPVLNRVVTPLNACVPTLNHSRATATNAKINLVSSACSLPNLNQYNTPPVTVDPIFGNHNNLRLLDSVNNAEHVRNMAGLQGTTENLNQHIWNGQALNNQVAPGNRANNYWDNFRSYSRQNLFSTKSNDGFQNSPVIDRTTTTTNNGITRTAPFEIHSMPKSNSHHVTQENIPQRSCVKPSRRYTNTNIAVVPPDVLNINQNTKNEGLPLSTSVSHNESDPNQYTNNVSRTPRRQSNITSGADNVQNLRRRNMVQDTAATSTSEAGSTCKLFEELRENVYQEVASLISANEARPHFLIQLFRDLQLISSDPLRLKTLQSIQVLISQSLRNSQNFHDLSPNQETPSSANEFSLQSTVWSPIPPSSVPRNATILEGLISKKGDLTVQNEDTFHEIVPFLNDNEHVTLNQHFLATLKQRILETKSFKRAVKDTIFQKHFANVLDDVLNFFNEKPLCTVKISLLQSIRDLLERELSFMNLIQSTGDSQLNDLVSSTQNLLELRCQFSMKSDTVETPPTVQIQNEDLAEADQSHVEDDDVEEEGAVGGFLEAAPDDVKKEEAEHSSSIEAFGVEAESQYQLGLDQVPTRLPMKSKSRSNTPNKDRTQKNDDHQDRLN